MSGTTITQEKMYTGETQIMYSPEIFGLIYLLNKMKSKIDLYNTCKVTIHKPDGSDLEFVNLNITCDIGRASIIKRLG